MATATYAKMAAQPIDANGNPLIAPVFAPQPETIPRVNLHAGLEPIYPPAPDVNAMGDPAQSEGMAKKLNPQEQVINNTQSRLAHDFEQDANPWGSPNNHPGVLGKIAHALNVPFGGKARELDEAALTNRLNTTEGNLGLSQERESKAQELQQGRIPLEQSRADQVEGANRTKEDIAAENNQSRENIAAMRITPEAHDAFHEWMQSPADYEKFQKAMTAAKAKPEGPAKNGGFMSAFAAVRALQLAYTHNPDLLPVLAPVLTHVFQAQGIPMPANAQEIFSSMPTGQPQNAEGKAIGTGMPESPTGTTRSRGQFAGEVLPTMHEAATEIDRIGDKLGPFMGRISDLITGKVGAYGPEFSALQTDLHNIATGWGRLHGNSVETMKQFYDDLNTSKDPANLKAKLERYERQAGIYKEGGAGRPGNQPAQGGAPKAGKPDFIYVPGKGLVKQ